MKTLVATLALAAVLSACADGYPPKDEGLILHFQMTESDALTALNRIGARDHLAHTWNYALKKGCQLEITTPHGAFKKYVSVVNLQTSEPLMFKSDSAGRYTTAMQAEDEPVSAHVLTNGTWSDATMVKWLLDYLPKFCV